MTCFSDASRRTAFHEAGHVVVSWALGMSPKWVAMSHDGTEGRFRPLRDGIILDPAQGVALCMSGLIGAELSGVPRFSDDEGRDDEGKAIDVGRRAHPDDDIAQASLHARGDELAHAERRLTSGGGRIQTMISRKHLFTPEAMSSRTPF